jgi:hypothetical protein
MGGTGNLYSVFIGKPEVMDHLDVRDMDMIWEYNSIVDHKKVERAWTGFM